MGQLLQLLNSVRAALLQSPRLALTAVFMIATLAPFAGLLSILVKDRRQAQRRRRGT